MPLLSQYLGAEWARLTALTCAPGRRRRLAMHFSARYAPVILLRMAQVLQMRWWARLVIGEGLVPMHTQGTGASSAGANVTVCQQVTLGARTADFAYRPELRPVVDDGVTLSAGAKFLGALALHRGCTVVANAVLLASIPANALAVGVPARIVPAADGQAVSPGRQ